MHFLNDNYKNKIFFLSLLFSCLSGRSASLPDSLIKTTTIIRSFEPNKIINTSPNYSIVFDESGIMFLGQENKISIYNGFSWSQLHIKGEILLTRNSLNTIFFSGNESFGFISPDSLQKFEVHLLYPFLKDNSDKKIKIRELQTLDKIVYCRSDSILFSYNLKEFTILDSEFQNGKIFKCGKNLIAVNSGNRVSVYNDNSKVKSIIFKGAQVKIVLDYDEGYLVITEDNKCHITNSSFEILNDWRDSSLGMIKTVTHLNSNEYLFTDINNNLFICRKDGSIISHINAALEFPNTQIVDIVQENSGNIWLLLSKSILRIEYPSQLAVISEIPSGMGKILDTKSYNNRIYIATEKGLFYLDPSSGKYHKTPLNDFCFKLIAGPDALLAFTGTAGFLLYKDKFNKVYSGKMLDLSWDRKTNSVFISEPDQIKILRFKDDLVVDSSSLYTPVKPLEIITIDSLLWISDGENIYMYSNPDKPAMNPVKIFIPDSSGISELFNWKNNLYVLTPNNIYSYIKGKIKIENLFSEALINEEFISFFSDSYGNSWLMRQNKDKNCILWFGSFTDNTFKEIILPPYISISNPSIDYVGNNKAILSAGSQIFMLDLNCNSKYKRKFETIIKKIETGEQVLFQGISYNFFRVPLRLALNNIPFNQNDIRIELSSTNYIDNEIKFQYILKGNDKTWSEWSSNSYIYMQGLKEGLYDLNIRCQDYQGETSEPVSLIFRISPPFYRTWWAYVFYALITGILLFIVYKTYLLNLHKARGLVSKLRDSQPEVSQIPVVINNTDETSTVNKKFDFFSNIDEDKVKDKTQWDKYEMVTVLFSDIQGFTKIAESMNPELLIDELDRFFYHFDSVVEKYNIEKIKTIGDAYMAAGGIPKKSNTNPIEVVLAALEMQNYMKQLKKTKIDIWDLRIGIHSGPVIAGVIGHKKRSFDIWGDTVNTASRMETTGEAGKVNISGETYKFVKDYFICEYRGKLPVKYKGNIDMYFVKGLRPELSINLGGLPNRKFYLKLQVLRLTDLEELIFSKLEAELNKNLHFHNLEYSQHLYEYSGLLSKAADLDTEETLLIRTATLLLNIGYTSGYENLENRSAEYGRNILPDYNYSEKQISVINNLVLSSKWPPEPRNMLEMVLYDIKMEYIGRADFIKLYKLLFLEQNQFLKSVDVIEFKRKQLEVIQQYDFFTESARRLREISLNDQINRIKEDDWN